MNRLGRSVFVAGQHDGNVFAGVQRFYAGDKQLVRRSIGPSSTFNHSPKDVLFPWMASLLIGLLPEHGPSQGEQPMEEQPHYASKLDGDSNFRWSYWTTPFLITDNNVAKTHVLIWVSWGAGYRPQYLPLTRAQDAENCEPDETPPQKRCCSRASFWECHNNMMIACAI